MVEDNKSRRLTDITGEKAGIIRAVILSKTTPLDDFEYPDKFQGVTNSPEQIERAQYSAQYISSKKLLDSSLDIHTYEGMVEWLKSAGFKMGIQDLGLGKLVEWDEVDTYHTRAGPSDESVDLAFRKEGEQQSRLFSEADNYFSKMCG